MGNATRGVEQAAYDTVGRYRQDEINGFTKELIHRMLEAADLARASSVLDAMAGDGNLTSRLHEFCRERGIPFPETCALEYSRVQAEFAKEALSSLPARAIWGDVLSMTDRGTGQRIPDGSFDRVLIKSGTHEIPREKQPELYGSVFQVLRPGGAFVNLGFLFDDREERDEVRELARVKDTLAKMHAAAANRYFLLREEFYDMLRQAGFVDVHRVHAIDYVIRSEKVAEQYYPPKDRLAADIENQVAQVRSLALRRSGRVRFEGATSILTFPGEITLARRPTMAETNARIFKKYPMDLLRHVEVHAEMLRETAQYVRDGSSVLDLGSGISLLLEHLPERERYTALDVSPEFIRVAKERYGSRPGTAFIQANIEGQGLGSEEYDRVTLLNVLHLPGIKPVEILRKALGALRPGGRIVVTGPTSKESLTRSEPLILAQLERDGHAKGNEESIQALLAANRRLLTENSNYWSVEGMVELLRHLGFSRTVAAHTGLYHGCAYLVVAEK